LPSPGNWYKAQQVVDQNKKEDVSRKGMNFAYCFSPIEGIATSSLRKRITGSIKDCMPLGAEMGFFLYACPALMKIQKRRIMLNRSATTFLVIDRSSGIPGFLIYYLPLLSPSVSKT
jgi:hypothetical protein